MDLPADEVPPELPEPCLGINFARDGMQKRDWMALVAVHSDSWLMAVAFFYGVKLDGQGRWVGAARGFGALGRGFAGVNIFISTSEHHAVAISVPSQRGQTCTATALCTAAALCATQSRVDLNFDPAQPVPSSGLPPAALPRGGAAAPRPAAADAAWPNCGPPMGAGRACSR